MSEGGLEIGFEAPAPVQPVVETPPQTPVAEQVDTAAVKETLAKQHFKYTLVFGQGPVQEKEKIPTAGREGLNFYSRIIALAAGEMLKQGITDKVILSGGETGARAGTSEASTEADLMADIIRRHLTTRSEDGKTWIANGKTISIPTNITPEGKEESLWNLPEVQKAMQEAYADKILIENEAKGTVDNFAYILEKYPPENPDEQVSLLGIGFHTKDTYSGAGIGRLQVLAEIFDLNGVTYSAEDVIRDLVSQTRDETSFLAKESARLSDLAETHEVSQLKSKQEKLLVEGLKRGAWINALQVLKDQKRSLAMIAKDPYLREHLDLTEEQISSMDFGQILDKIGQIRVEGTDEDKYREVKGAVFERLKQMSEEEDVDYYGKYAKGELPKTEQTQPVETGQPK